MDDITVIHQKVLDHLIELRKTNSNLFFVPRRINNYKRLDKGYWFLGNEGYLHLSFWIGRDRKEKVHNIGFVVLENGESYIELTARVGPQKTEFVKTEFLKREFMKKIMLRIPGFEQCGIRVPKDKWKKDLQRTDYIKNLDDFIKNIKPIIDEMVITARPEKLTIPTKEFFDKYGEKVIRLYREKQNREKQMD